jgi:hypothetical protein
MSKLEVLFQQRGTGYLILKRGICKQIEWEIEVLRDGSIKGGSVRGDKKHLKAAAKDGCVKLSLTSEITVAIAINRYKDGEAFFTALLISRSPPAFAAQTIVGSGPILDGSIYSIEFAGADGEAHIVTIPTIIIRDYLPMFRKLVPPASPTSPPTSYFHIPKIYKTATAASSPFVCVRFDNDPPLGLSPERARQLAGELLELAEDIDARSITAH